MRTPSLPLLLIAVLALSVATPHAAADPVRFDIPAQPADRALLAFSHQCHDEVLFSFDALSKVRANAVVGVFEPAEAIALLLKGSPFVARRSGDHQFVVKRAPRPATASIRGRLLAPGGSPAQGIRVDLDGAGLFMLTDENGEYFFHP